MRQGLLESKITIPSKRAKLVLRPDLLTRLNDGLELKLSLVCASAGFGKTTLLSDWLLGVGEQVAWLSLEKADNDLGRFLRYMVAALQKLDDAFGLALLSILDEPQLPSAESLMTFFIKDLAVFSERVILVLDDFHCIDLPVINVCLELLVEHKPDVLHFVIATREDPALPLARWRVRNQVAELRVADLRFSLDETHSFLKQVMNLSLSNEDISLLEGRTEGWIAGLQLAALSMQGYKDNASGFIKTFTGSHRFVLDYLIEEVMNQQSEEVQAFLLKTSILERFSASLCDAIVAQSDISAQEMLEQLERANLFIIPLDNERHWYRYHHLFSDLLKQRLAQMYSADSSAINALHQKASQWYEDHDFELDAFYHATKANDVKRAIRLIEGKGIPLHFRGAIAEIKHWLDTLEKSVLDDNPILWTTYASVTLSAEKVTETQDMLLAAEAALNGKEHDEETKDQLGRIAAIRATIAVSSRQVDVIVRESERALSYLNTNNLAFRLSTAWKLGFAYQNQGKREQAMEAYAEVVNLGEPAGELIFSKLALFGLANLQEENNELRLAEQTYQRVLKLTEGQPDSIASFETKLGLARIAYEWNDLERLEKLLALLASQAKTTDSFMDSFIGYAIMQARFKLTQQDFQEASQLLSKAEKYAQEHNLTHRIPKLSELKTLVLLQQGNIIAAQDLAQTYQLSQGQARVYLAKGDYPNALLVLEPLLQNVSSKNYKDQMLMLLVLMAKSFFVKGNLEAALEKLAAAFNLAAANGFVRSFINEGLEMKRLLEEAKGQGIMPDYVDKLLASFEPDEKILTQLGHSLIEPLSERELEILKLIAQGLTNREIGEKLFRALDTIKGHNRSIFGKLQVKNRVEAITRARELGLL